MSKKFAFAAALAAACIAAAGAAQAGANRGAWPVVTDQAGFTAQAAQVRKDMTSSGKYGAISPDDRDAVEESLDKAGALIAKTGQGHALSDQEQVELVNAQEQINAILTRNKGNRLICRYEAPSGSHLRQKICETAMDHDKTRRNAQDVLLQNKPQRQYSGPNS
jgi:hypothetical protein